MNSVAHSQQSLFFAKEGGFRLDLLEVYNWGTFNGKVWALKPEREHSLLTGENGSGKSTLVDALLTLLVPNRKRNYNLSSGSERKERSESSYCRGAYGNERNALNQKATKYLRGEDHYSVILGHFQNSATKGFLCLGQFFWHENQVLKKFFITSEIPLGISTHFQNIKNISQIRKKLREIPGLKIYASFADYEAALSLEFGFESSKALDLFNQTVAIKEIGRLNDFVRQHMLAPLETQDSLSSLYSNYENLNLAFQAIVLAKNQLEKLNPIAQDAEALKKVGEANLQLQKNLDNLPLFFAHQRADLLSKEFLKKKEEKAELDQKLEKWVQRQSSIESKKESLQILLRQEGSAQQLEKLDLLVAQSRERHQRTQEGARRYTELAQIAEVETEPNLKQFSQTLANLSSITQEVEEEEMKCKEDIFQLRKERDLIQGKLASLLQEHQSLKNRKSKIPKISVEIRERLAEHLGVLVDRLPFTAELIQVKSGEEDWRGAIEKLLYPFAMRLLIDESHYSAVNRYLNKNQIGTKLVYVRVDMRSIARGIPNVTIREDADALIHKLEFKPRSEFSHWVQEQIQREYQYICTNDLSRFQREQKALTPQGLIKRGSLLHEKDDRYPLSDPSRFILGWNNTEKLGALERGARELQGELSTIDRKIQSSQKNQDRLNGRRSALEQLSRITSFADIDYKTASSELDSLKESQSKLKGSSKAGNVKSQLDQVQDEIKAAFQERDQFISSLSLIDEALKKLPAEISNARNLLEGKEERDYLSVSVLLKKKLTEITEFPIFEREIQEDLQRKQKIGMEKQQTLSMSLIRQMAQFKEKFPEQSHQLDASMEYLSDYLQLKEKIERESLPSHEQRFKQLLSRSVIADMASFKASLDLGYERIEETISLLNRSLMKIPYSANSYVEIQLERTRNPEVRDFQSLLRKALRSLDQGSSEEESFHEIRKILTHLREDESWCARVTDVRNWADFSVQEKYLQDHAPKNFYSDSGGLSGGQKAKLAFTILASALAHQYGIHGGRSTERSFRFVVIDEAFSKSDERNSRYAMELFTELGLQLMVVTPMDKIHIVEPYVKKIFLVTNNETSSDSQVCTVAIESIYANSKAFSPSLEAKEHELSAVHV